MEQLQVYQLSLGFCQLFFLAGSVGNPHLFKGGVTFLETIWPSTISEHDFWLKFGYHFDRLFFGKRKHKNKTKRLLPLVASRKGSGKALLLRFLIWKFEVLAAGIAGCSNVAVLVTIAGATYMYAIQYFNTHPQAMQGHNYPTINDPLAVSELHHHHHHHRPQDPFETCLQTKYHLCICWSQRSTNKSTLFFFVHAWCISRGQQTHNRIDSTVLRVQQDMLRWHTSVDVHIGDAYKILQNAHIHYIFKNTLYRCIYLLILYPCKSYFRIKKWQTHLTHATHTQRVFLLSPKTIDSIRLKYQSPFWSFADQRCWSWRVLGVCFGSSFGFGFFLSALRISWDPPLEGVSTCNYSRGEKRSSK